jgi:hypothetical protein
MKVLNNYIQYENGERSKKLVIVLKKGYIKHLIIDPVNYYTGVVVEDELFKYHI